MRIKTIFFGILGLMSSVSILYSAESLSSLSETVKQVSPSVVKIKVKRSDDVKDNGDFVFTDASGSGFVFDVNGHILTNAHVVKDAKKIIVCDVNNTEIQASVVGSDQRTDIAIIKVDKNIASPVSLGDSFKLSEGDFVFAVGSPFSLGHSVSAGIVSKVKRFLPSTPHLLFIQTDAAINPGNSGGPLFDIGGKLVGVASMSFSRSGGYSNIGFAIPVEDAIRIGKELVVKGKIERGMLGADVAISERVAKKMGYQNGVLVSRVYSGYPAELSGIHGGDLIIEVNKIEIKDGGELHRVLESMKPQDSIDIVFVRNKVKHKAKITLSKAQEPKPVLNNAGSKDKADEFGIIAKEHPDKQAVEVLASYSSAALVGFESGDIIKEIDGKQINSLKILNNSIGKIGDKNIGIAKIIRKDKTILLPIGSKKAVQTSGIQRL